MKKVGRVIFTIFLSLLGTVTIAIGLVLLTQGKDWMTQGFAIAVMLFGIATIASAWFIARGARIKDILEDIFLGLP